MGAAVQIPFVDYLVLDPQPHLVARECVGCRARFFDRRNACARCSGVEFGEVDLAAEGTVRSFTIVAVDAPGIDVPYVAAVVDLDGTSVRANIVNCPPDPEHVVLGMQVRLTTVALGVDDHGVEAVNYGFEPA